LNYKSKLICRKYITDHKGGRPYVRRQTEEEFCETVNKEMNELRDKGAKKISVQHFQSLNTDTDREIIKAIITYMI
jgi:hypothetical protein